MDGTYPQDRTTFIEVLRQVNRLCLAFIYFLQGNDSVGIGIEIDIRVRVHGGVSLALRLAGCWYKLW